HPLRHGGVRRDVLLAGDHAQSHPQPPSHAVRRPHHLLPDRRARGPEPPVAEHPQLFSCLALRVLSTREKEDLMRRHLAILPAVESYERFKKEGAVTMAVYGTPQIYALAAKLTEDRIPGTSPGFGSAAAADGQRYPYIFPIAATYWSQGAAAVEFVKKQFNGN